LGYQPAVVTTTAAGINHMPAAHYKKRGLDKLKKKFRFLSITEPDDLPRRSGKTVQWFRYALLAADITPSSEGTVGTSESLTNSIITATVEEYSNFITTSSLARETFIDDPILESVDSLSYQAGITVDTLARNEFDAGSGVTIATLAGAASGADIRRVTTILESNDVQPRDGDEFMGIIHSFILYDLMSDNTAGGFLEMAKYANTSLLTMNGERGKIGGCRLIVSTNVTTSGTAPNVLYNTYIAGKGGVGHVALSGSGPSKVVDPRKETFAINVIPGKPQLADPEGMIGGAVSYRFVQTMVNLDTTTPRYRILQADASLV
jgi:N4-gp56 family major capsid protein